MGINEEWLASGGGRGKWVKRRTDTMLVSVRMPLRPEMVTKVGETNKETLAEAGR